MQSPSDSVIIIGKKPSIKNITGCCCWYDCSEGLTDFRMKFENMFRGVNKKKKKED
jgi:hypothetical protein